MAASPPEPDVAALQARIAELEAQQARLRQDTEVVAAANVQAALEMVQLAESARLEVEVGKQHAEEALACAEAALAHKSRFLARMSHELRTPLGGVVGMTALLLETVLDPVQLEYARTIAVSAEALLELINQVLDYSKIETDQIAMETVDFDLWQALERVARPHALRARGNGLAFRLHIAPGAPRRWTGDPTRLRQILDNLCGNAIKFTARGSVEMVAAVADGALVVSVHDTGVGIDPATVARLFEPFEQADGSSTRRYGGTGLGLAISRGLAQRMGGTLTARGEPGRGSTFELRLPLGAAVATPAAPAGSRGDALVLGLDDAVGQAAGEHLAWAGFRVRVGLAAVPGGDRPTLVLAPNPSADAALVAALAAWRSAGTTVLVLADVDAVAAPVPEGVASATIAQPLRPSELVDAALAAVPAAPTPSTPGTFPGTHVLVVEDIEVNQRVVRAMLDKLGCMATVVSDGAQAVAAVAERPFDLVLMDCQMPVMDGYTATRTIRANGGRQVPIVALTANALPGDRERCLAAGMDDYLAKPVRREQLAAVFARWMRNLN